MVSVVLSSAPRDVHRAITEKIVQAIESGPNKFEMPWHRAGAIRRPENALTGMTYRGANVLSLWVDALSKGYPTGYWASYRQWQALGAQVQGGEHGSLILFYKRLNPIDEEDEEKRPRFVVCASTVFNAAQVSGWSPPEPPHMSAAERIARAEDVVSRTRANIRESNFDIACYDPLVDRIDMPKRSLFVGSKTSTPTEAYYATLFHELTHWTGHQSRLARDLKNRFGDVAYAIEELVAELGAAFLSADLGITTEPRPDHAAYIHDWLQVLKRDPRALAHAANKASVATEFLLETSGFEPRAAINTPIT